MSDPERFLVSTCNFFGASRLLDEEAKYSSGSSHGVG